MLEAEVVGMRLWGQEPNGVGGDEGSVYCVLAGRRERGCGAEEEEEEEGGKTLHGSGQMAKEEKI